MADRGLEVARGRTAPAGGTCWARAAHIIGDSSHFTVSDRTLPPYGRGMGTSGSQSGEPTGTGAALTPRELEAVHLVVEGLSNREIAERLSISARTVQSHLEAAMAKTATKTRTQLAVAALRTGLVLSDEEP